MSLTVTGGGVVGAEMATAYAGLGTAVTLIARGGLLENMEPFAGGKVAAALRAQGVTVLLDTEATQVARNGDKVVVQLGDGSTVTAEEALVRCRSPIPRSPSR